MQFLVRSRLSNGARPDTEAEGLTFIRNYIFPTLERCTELRKERKIVAGGPESGAVALALIVEVGSAAELDELITSLPAWPRMETVVTPVLEALESRARTQQVAEDPH